jgi:hypothetical protein
MIISSEVTPLEFIIRDMKSFTATHIRKAMKNNISESRTWMMKMMINTGQMNSNNKHFQFWQQNNKPIELNSNMLLQQKLDYIHNNPVKEGFVYNPKDFVYSSALDYAGGKGLIDIVLIQ